MKIQFSDEEVQEICSDLVTICGNILTFLFKFALMYIPNNGNPPIEYMKSFEIIFDEYKAFSANEKLTKKVNGTRKALDCAVSKWNKYRGA